MSQFLLNFRVDWKSLKNEHEYEYEIVKTDNTNKKNNRVLHRPPKTYIGIFFEASPIHFNRLLLAIIDLDYCFDFFLD